MFPVVGRVYICDECITEMARSLEILVEDDQKKFLTRIKVLEKTNDSLNARLRKVEEAHAALDYVNRMDSYQSDSDGGNSVSKSTGFDAPRKRASAGKAKSK